MFLRFKSKVASIKSEITSSLATVGHDILNATSPRSSYPVAETPSSSTTSLESIPYTSDDSYDHKHTAAQGILHRFELAWQDLHKSTELNVNKVESLNKELSKTEHDVMEFNKFITQLDSEVKSLPSIAKYLNDIKENVAEIHSLAALIEDDLSSLEVNCEYVRYNQRKLDEFKRLEQYREHKKRQLTNYEAGKKAEYDKHLKRLEEEEIAGLVVKQQIYQRAFDADMKRYKEEQLKKKETSDISQVVLPTTPSDADLLESFLDDQPGANGAFTENKNKSSYVNCDDHSANLDQSPRDDTVSPVDDTVSPDVTSSLPEVTPSHSDAMFSQPDSSSPLKDIITNTERDRTNTESTVESVDERTHSGDSLQWDEDGDDVATLVSADSYPF